MQRDAFIIAFTGTLTLLFLLVVVTQQPIAFLPFAFLYLLGFAGQAILVYGGSQWADISLKILYPIAVVSACGLLLVAVAWLSGNSFAYLFRGFFGKGGLGWAFAPYVVGNLVAYVLVIIRESAHRQTL